MMLDALPRETAADVRVRVPLQGLHHQDVTLHLGATNSGKTHASLAELATAGRGIYVAPLRMLAQEVFNRLVAECGADRVGLMTGDQILRPEAPILCCTAEMAPLDAPFAVIDEAHWLDDPSRGKSWTRLLVEGRYPRISVIAAAEAAPFLLCLFPNAEVIEHRRLGELWDGGPTTLDMLWPGTVVVAFSRPAVLALAREISANSGLRTGVLYGALPAKVRHEQVARFEAGQLDVLVATDSIGHGVNLPTTTIVFAETEKFDGVRRRPLRPWEAAQIAGRAGRGTGRPGLVRTLKDLPGFRADPRVVIDAIGVALGTVPSDLSVRRAPVAPAFDDLGTDDPSRLAHHVAQWLSAAEAEFTTHPWAGPADLSITLRRLDLLRDLWAGAWPLDALTTWNLASAPLASDHAFRLGAAALVDPSVDLALELEVDVVGEADLAVAERTAAISRDLTTLAHRVGPLNGFEACDFAAVTSVAEDRVAARLDEAILSNTFGRCGACGAHIAPRFSSCGPCRRKRLKRNRSGRH